ncbi:prion-inhibition and propagation-domain-containing protein [Chaetomium strumarium]|uniref:Prion-inhibition and propagation-domain-containing protein n=1 Tax=Chaetomium strumarium TaxID=1170767 RepID=A0AAJ0GNV9_9PEZI|nr:prion-inhibition and propagation-domain-containing protein [Chaetomium strumarium]
MDVATGVISLTWEVFDSTVRIFKFLTALVDMPREYEKYSIQLIVEYNRVLAFGKAAGLVDVPAGSTLGATLGTEGIELVAIVARIHWLLSEIRELNARYGNELPQSGKAGDNKTGLHEQPTDSDLLKAILGLALTHEAEKRAGEHLRGVPRIKEWVMKLGRNSKDIISCPVRVRWVAVDKEAFELLLDELHVLTERLHELMRNHREKQVDDITAKTLVTRSTGVRKEKAAHLNDQQLGVLPRLKIFNRASHNLNLFHLFPDHFQNRFLYSCVDLAQQLAWNEDQVDKPELLRRPRAILSTPDKVDILVWIEWKTLGDIEPGSPQHEVFAVRTAALALMLNVLGPVSLHTPDCMGYFDDRDVNDVARYGWLFKIPEGSDRDTRVRSLHDILGDERYKPSPSQRVAMASKLCSTLLNLHAADWLHKGIFSDSVVFFFAGEEEEEESNDAGTLRLPYDPEKPVLSGFEFSRPDGSQTTGRDVEALWDLYRWPSIRRESPTERSSRKTYDLYSLGLVLLEIAHWEKLHKLMHLGGGVAPEGEGEGRVPQVPLGESRMVRDWLLGIQQGAPFEVEGKPNPLKELRYIAGDRYWKAVEKCLWAHGEKGFGVQEVDQSRDSDVGMALQEAFTTHVVEELASINI